MEMMAGNTALSVIEYRKEKNIRDVNFKVGKAQNPHRSGKNRLTHFNKIDQVMQQNGAESSCIQALEDDLRHYRSMLERLMQKRMEKMSYRVVILEFCNSTLAENYHKMHQMYLEMLIKTQVLTNEMCESQNHLELRRA